MPRSPPPVGARGRRRTMRLTARAAALLICIPPVLGPGSREASAGAPGQGPPPHQAAGTDIGVPAADGEAASDGSDLRGLEVCPAIRMDTANCHTLDLSAGAMNSDDAGGLRVIDNVVP